MSEPPREPDRPDRGPVQVYEADVTAPTPRVEETLFHGGALSAFSHRDFSLLWSGAFVSNVGTWIQTTVLLWYVKELTNSNAWVGAVNLASFLPILLFVIYAGSLADRVDRRKLIIVTQVVMGLAALGLAIATSLGQHSLALIMGLTVTMGVAFVFNFPAWRAMVPDLVPPEDLLNGIALDAAQFNMARFVGPAIGAIIISVWSVSGAFYINAASFVAVIAALLLIRARPVIVAPQISASKHIMEGFSYLRENPWAVKLLAVLLVESFFGIATIVLLPSEAKDVLHGGSLLYGLLVGAIGLGAVCGAPLVTLLHRRYSERAIIKGTLLAFSIILFVLALSHNDALSIAMTFSIGVVFLMASATINTVLQSRVERNMRGRIMSFYILVFQGTSPLGGLLLGFVSDRRSTPFAVGLGATVCLLMSIVIIAAPSVLRDAVSPTVTP
ncbi:MAG TPA: MFS transporter [Candidatus Anoxymicrobiaceae bacterium]|jgi:MFS family permease